MDNCQGGGQAAPFGDAARCDNQHRTPGHQFREKAEGGHFATNMAAGLQALGDQYIGPCVDSGKGIDWAMAEALAFGSLLAEFTSRAIE